MFGFGLRVGYPKPLPPCGNCIPCFTCKAAFCKLAALASAREDARLPTLRKGLVEAAAKKVELVALHTISVFVFDQRNLQTKIRSCLSQDIVIRNKKIPFFEDLNPWLVQQQHQHQPQLLDRQALSWFRSRPKAQCLLMSCSADDDTLLDYEALYACTLNGALACLTVDTVAGF